MKFDVENAFEFGFELWKFETFFVNADFFIIFDPLVFWILSGHIEFKELYDLYDLSILLFVMLMSVMVVYLNSVKNIVRDTNLQD